MTRCSWCGTDPIYVAYHDQEWGVPERDPRALWEKLVLDGFQAGLSWITILKKRDNFREEFEGFDPERVACWDEGRIDKALQNRGIIRHRGKIAATVNGARRFLEIEQAEGFSPWLWSFVGGDPIQNGFADATEVPAATPESVALSKALKKRGFSFCGPVITYAFMQATGMVNDHMTSCPRHAQVSRLSAAG
ncbi:DNA-3-methyladenine glycosylase I [Paracoccus salsus]|uniref:DNA-3-methyladenine glycosylase I n=1 Tax=Paracoccus salsus TaxID=2911061 RepID=UPI001F3E2437|nr:DNA-3-methyladenine glycosylase I [Paracoccus salsus]MCF3973018.1 DNA-3-methyladenine glycosylase I [Paracoccus salsus]